MKPKKLRSDRVIQIINRLRNRYRSIGELREALDQAVMAIEQRARRRVAYRLLAKVGLYIPPSRTKSAGT